MDGWKTRSKPDDGRLEADEQYTPFQNCRLGHFFSSRPHDCPSHIHSSRHLVNYNVERFEQLINEDLALYKIHYYFYYLSTILHSEIMVQAIFLISSRPTHEFHDSSFQFHSSRRLVDSTKSGNIR